MVALTAAVRTSLLAGLADILGVSVSAVFLEATTVHPENPGDIRVVVQAVHRTTSAS